MTAADTTTAAPVAPDPAGDDFVDFLHWLSDQGATAADVIYVVEKPHKHTTAYQRYVAAGGPGR